MPYATYPTRTAPPGLFAHDSPSPSPPNVQRPSSPGSPSTFFRAASDSSASSPTSPYHPSAPSSPSADCHQPPSASSSSFASSSFSSATVGTSGSHTRSSSSRVSLLATSARLTYLSALAATVLCALFNLVLASYVVKLARDSQQIVRTARVRMKRAKLHVDYWSKKWRVVGAVARVVPWPIVWVVVQMIKRAGVGKLVGIGAGQSAGGQGGKGQPAVQRT